MPSTILVSAQFNDHVQFKHTENLFTLYAQHVKNKQKKSSTINQLNSPGLITICIFMQIIPMISVEVTQRREVSYSSSWRERSSCLITLKSWRSQGTCWQWAFHLSHWTVPILIRACLLSLCRKWSSMCWRAHLTLTPIWSLGNVSLNALPQLLSCQADQ